MATVIAVHEVDDVALAMKYDGEHADDGDPAAGRDRLEDR